MDLIPLELQRSSRLVTQVVSSFNLICLWRTLLLYHALNLLLIN